jgi:ABC-type multidrug transport system fused ATPase/permease subunit
MIINSLLEVFAIGLVIPLVQLIISNDNINSDLILNIASYFKISGYDFLKIIIILYLFFQIFKTFYSLFYIWFENRYIYNFKKKLSSKLLYTYLYQDYLFLLKNNSAKLMRNITYCVDSTTLYLFQFLKFSLDIIIASFIFTFLLFYNFNVTILISIFFLIISLVYSLTLRNKLLEMGFKRQEIAKNRLQFFQDSVENFKYIKISSKEEFFYEKFDVTNDKVAKISSYSEFLKNIPRPFLELSAIFLFLSFLFYYVFTTENVNLNIFEVLAVYLVAALRFLPAISRMLSAIQQLKISYPDVLKMIKELSLEVPSKSIPNHDLKFQNEININIGKFSYEEENKFDLKDLKLKININEKVGLVGESGSGKSSILDILLGIIPLKNGSVMVDANKIDKKNLSSWHKKIAYVPQKITIIEDTILNNILFGLSLNDTTLKKINHLIKLTNLEGFINSKEQGIHSIISEKGSNISGGELQRIAFCRALIRDPQILILDEPTSALDIKNEELFTNMLAKLENKTIIHVSHKMSSLKYCDKVYQIKNNKLQIYENF